MVPWSLSASHVAFASVRMEPVFMILGQSAGSAACIAIDENCTVQQVSYEKLKAQLVKNGQVLIEGAIGVSGTLSKNTDWMLGPFKRPPQAQPVIEPNSNSVFDCPMRKMAVHWEATHTFNPAAVVKDGKVWLFYRAEDQSGSQHIGSYTSRLGLATSEDGIHFTRRPTPVLYPDNDDQKEREWEGGCEDPRCVELEDGTYRLLYTQYSRLPGVPRKTTLGIARSTDLIHWTKEGFVSGLDEKGRIVAPHKSASLVCGVRDGRLIAARINGRYWLYYGEGAIHLMTSEDLRVWTPVKDFTFGTRPNHFDSGLAECGPPALMTERGIVLLYNGKNANPLKGGDPALKNGAYAGGQALFDANDPTKLLARSESPFIQPELPWEAGGQYGAGTTFIEGLVLLRGQWFLYYGCADSLVGVAVAPGKKEYRPERVPGHF